MSLRDELARQKLEGEREWDAVQADEQRKRDDEAARKRDEEEKRRTAELARQRTRAEEMFALLPDAVRNAASRGLETAVLADSFVTDRAEPDKPSHPLIIDRKTYYLTGWQIPFAELCHADNIPLTVVTERVDVALKGVLHKTFHILAIDLKHL